MYIGSTEIRAYMHYVFALSRQHMLWWHQVTLMVAATAGFLAILEQREIGGGLAAQGRFLSGACR